MAAKLGTSAALFRVGSGSPSKVFLGAQSIQNVPGVPVVIASVVAPGGSATAIVMQPIPDDGGSPITTYRITIPGIGQLNSVSISTGTSGGQPAVSANFFGSQSGRTLTIQAINALGVSESSEPFAVP